MPVVPVVPCCCWLPVLVFVFAPSPNILPVLALALLGGFEAELAFPNRDGVVLLFVFAPSPNILPVLVLVLLEGFEARLVFPNRDGVVVLFVFAPSPNILPALALALALLGGFEAELVFPNRDGVVVLLVFAPSPNILPALALLALLGGFGAGLVLPNRDGVVVLLWAVFVFCDNPKRPPVLGLGLALEELAGGLANKELPVVPVVPCCCWLLVLVFVFAPSPSILPALVLALLRGFGAGLVLPNRDGVVVLLWVVFVFCDNPKRPPVLGLALEGLAGGLANKELPVVPVVPCCCWLLVLAFVFAPSPNILPVLALALLGGFGAGLVFPNKDGVVVLLWVVFALFCDNPKRPPVFVLALEELAGGLAKKELKAIIQRLQSFVENSELSKLCFCFRLLTLAVSVRSGAVFDNVFEAPLPAGMLGT